MKKGLRLLVLLFSILCMGMGVGFAQNELTDSLWNKFNHLPSDSSRVDTIIQSVLKMRNNLKNSPEEEKMLLSALAIAQKMNYKKGEARCFDLLGVFYRETSRYEEAINNHKRALEISQSIHDSTSIAYAYNNMGVAYRRLDETEKAFKYHFDALNISRATGDRRNRAIAMNSIGNIYLSIGDFKSAIIEFEQCLKQEKEMGINIGQAINNANLGEAYEGLGEFDKAIAYYKEALKFNQLENSDKGLAITYNLLGKVYLKKNDYDLALSYLNDAVSYNHRLRDRINVADNYITIGKIYVKKGEYKNALDVLNRGLVIAREIGSQSLIIDAYKVIGQTESMVGNYDKGYDFLNKAYELRDSIFKEQATPQMAKMRTLYELDKKEDQIRLLRQENQINQLKLNNRLYTLVAAGIIIVLLFSGILFFLYNRRQKSYKLMLEYELQSLRSQMNPHFIFNAMNSIDNYIWKNKREEASSYLIKFSNLMRMTLQNSRTKTIRLADEIGFLKLYLELENFRLEEKLNYRIEISPELDVDEVVIPSMVVQPFVENAVLHGLSHKDDGERLLIIRFYRNENLIVCEVEDNGVGREAAKASQENKLFKKQSVGIQVTEERVALLKQITGNRNLQIKIIDLKDDGNSQALGTKVIIRLPLAG